MRKSHTALTLFAAFLALQLLSLPPKNTLTYDGALYIDIARSLTHGVSNFTYQGIYMMYRPPLYPYTLSAFYHFIHEPLNQLTTARLVSAVFFALTASVVYLLAREILGKEVKALAAVGFFVFNSLAFTMGTRELVHSEFTFFYTLAVYLLYTGRKSGSRARICTAFFSAGLAILTRYTGLSILAVFLAYLWLTEDWRWVRKREYWMGFGVLVLTLLPWLYMGHAHYGGAFRPFSVASRVVTLDRPVSVSDYLKLILRDMGRVLPALSVLGVFRLKKDDKGWLMVSWLSMGLFGILSVTHKETRFITFLAPAMAIMAVEGVSLAADGLLAMGRILRISPGERWRAVLLAGLAILLLIPVAMSAHSLHERWNLEGRAEATVLSQVSAEHPAGRLLISPGLYTMAGFYYPGSRVDMTLDTKRIRLRISEGYYEVIILREPANHLNIEESGRYFLAEEFYRGKFKVYLLKENGES